MLLRLFGHTVPHALAGPILVDGVGVPRYWPTVWAALDGAALAESTLRRHLAAIDQLYIAVEERLHRDCLDEILSRADFESLGPILEAHFLELRNRGADDSMSATEAWRSAIQFVRDILNRIGHANATKPRIYEIQARLQRLDALYAQLRPVRHKTTKTVRALPSTVVAELDELTRPDDPRNPFRSQDNAYRNYALFKLMQHQGLRRGEACILPLDAIKEGYDDRSGESRFWINIAENPYETTDERHDKPSLKTPTSTRQLPISTDLVDIVETYTQSYRGTQKHSFLFSSQRGKPLSMQMVNSIFSTLSEALSERARVELWDKRRKRTVTPHDLRHTAAVVRLTEFLADGTSMDVAMSKLRSCFGWTMDSTMPNHYARAYFEHQLATVWENRFDAHIDHLRSVESDR